MSQLGVEKFLIETVFDDEKAIDGIKNLLGMYDKMAAAYKSKAASAKTSERTERASIQKTTKAIQQQNKALKQGQSDEAPLLKAQSALRRQIRTATNMGIDVKGFKQTLSTASDIERIRLRTAELEARITSEQLKQAEAARRGRSNAEAARQSQQRAARESRQIVNQISTVDTRLRRAVNAGVDISSFEEAKNTVKTLEEAKKLSTDVLAAIRRAELATAKSNALLRRQTLAPDPQNEARAAQAREAARERMAQDNLKRNRHSALYQRSQQFASADPKIAARLKQIEKAYISNRKATLNGAAANAQFNASLRDLNNSVIRARQRILSLTTVQNGLRDSTRNMVRQYASMFALFGATRSINSVGQQFEGLDSAMLAAFGNMDEAQAEIEHLDKLTTRLGMSLLDTATSYTKFIFASKGKMDTSEVRFLFDSMSELGTVLGLDKNRLNLSFVAIQQMMNKTTVMSEELKRQLAESFPGAIQIFANAAGVGERELFEMMERGEVMAADILPNVAKEMSNMARSGGALAMKLKTTRVQQGRFFKQLETAEKNIFRSGMDEGLASMFLTMADNLQNSQAGLEGLGKTFKAIFEVIGGGARVLIPVLNWVSAAVGNVVSLFDALLINKQAGYAAGIAAMLLLFRNLSRVVNSLAFKVLFAIWAINELFSLWSKDAVGDIEFMMGRNVGFEDTPFGSALKFFSGSGFGKAVGEFLIAALIIHTSFKMMAGILGALGIKGAIDKAKGKGKGKGKGGTGGRLGAGARTAAAGARVGPWGAAGGFLAGVLLPSLASSLFGFGDKMPSMNPFAGPDWENYRRNNSPRPTDRSSGGGRSFLQLSADVTINPSAGADPEEIARQTQRALDEAWAIKIEETARENGMIGY